MAAEHLLDLGARRIAFAGGFEGRPITLERRSGYLAVMKEHGLEPLLLAGRSSRAFGRDAAVALTEAHREADAVIGFNDSSPWACWRASIPSAGSRAATSAS